MNRQVRSIPRVDGCSIFGFQNQFCMNEKLKYKSEIDKQNFGNNNSRNSI